VAPALLTTLPQLSLMLPAQAQQHVAVHTADQNWLDVFTCTRDVDGRILLTSSALSDSQFVC